MALLYPQVDPLEWGANYKIDNSPMICKKCGKEFPMDKPFAFGGMRGLAMSDHGCGDNGQCIMVAYSEEEKAFFEKVRKWVANDQ